MEEGRDNKYGPIRWWWAEERSAHWKPNPAAFYISTIDGAPHNSIMKAPLFSVHDALLIIQFDQQLRVLQDIHWIGAFLKLRSQYFYIWTRRPSRTSQIITRRQPISYYYSGALWNRSPSAFFLILSGFTCGAPFNVLLPLISKYLANCSVLTSGNLMAQLSTTFRFQRPIYLPDPFITSLPTSSHSWVFPERDNTCASSSRIRPALSIFRHHMRMP